MQSEMNWVIEVSKLCNLRCAYCYQRDWLPKPDRISLDDWRTLLTAIRTYHDLRSRQQTVPFQTIIVWHGGEPLLLPTDYIESVVRLQRNILGSEALSNSAYVNVLQTNLYRITEEKLDFLQRENFQVGISMDVIGGVRVSAAGQETEDTVARNMDILRGRDIEFGAIVVLAGHTYQYVNDIYDFYESLEIPVRFLPVFDVPGSTLETSVAIGKERIVEALNDLFVHWITRPNRVQVEPLVSCLEVTLCRMLGETQPRYDRRHNGEWAIIVNTDGTLFEDIDAYNPAEALGNIFQQRIEEILSSPGYRNSLDRDEMLIHRYCGSCEFLGPCTTLPLFESAKPEPRATHCPIAHAVCQFMYLHVRENALSASKLQSILQKFCC